MSKLRIVRKKLNLSIDEVSRSLGISAGYLSQIELGKRQISNKRAEEIASFYEMKKEQIFLPTRYAIRKVWDWYSNYYKLLKNILFGFLSQFYLFIVAFVSRIY